MIEITATAESIEQARALMDIGVDIIYAGEDKFGLRLPHSFEREELRELVKVVHQAGKKVTVAVTGIMHPEKMKDIPDYLSFLKEIGVDQIEIGDAGILYVMKRDHLDIPFVYNTQMTITNDRQINFWGKRGAVKAVLGREVPYEEMKEIAPKANIPVEVLVYGATCIHQSLRPLIQNYFNYIHMSDDNRDVSRQRGLFLSEPKKPETHYSIYEDQHGTHVFATNDIDLMKELPLLSQIPFNHWKLDGLFTPGDSFVNIAQYFVKAKEAIESGRWNEDLANQYDEAIRALHPNERDLDTGFFYYSADDVK